MLLSEELAMNPNVRPAAVAGMFYPESRDVLGRNVMQMLAGVAKKQMLRPKAIIVPHAGYIYSGPVAASSSAPLSALCGTI